MRIKFKEMRIKKGLTLQEIASKVNISKVYLWQIENNKRRLNYGLAIKLATLFNLKPDELFYDDELEIISKNNYFE